MLAHSNKNNQVHKYYRSSLEEKASFSKVHKIQKLVGLRHHRQHSTNSNNSLIKMLRSLGTAFISISFIIILFCDISDGVKKIRYRKIQNPKSNGLFGGDSTADIYGFLNRISPPHGNFLNFFYCPFLNNLKIFQILSIFCAGMRFELLDPPSYTTPSTTTTTTTTTTTRHNAGQKI